jgi:hypothetical protein
MLMRGDVVPAGPAVPGATHSTEDATEPRWSTALPRPRRQDVRMFGMIFVSNMTLFCALDMAQWVAERFDMSSLPTNITAAVIATALGLIFAAAARWLGVENA